MNEIPHCELERFHYQALKSREYQVEGMIDCETEYLMSLMLYRQETPQREIKPMFRPRPIHHEIDQLKTEITHLHLEIDRMKGTKKKKEEDSLPF